MPGFPAIRMANLEALLSKTWTQAVEGGEVDAGGLDAQVRDAGLRDLADIFGETLTSLAASGCSETGGTLRETGMNTVLGYVSFKCRYHAPAPGAPVSRQDRR